jgi:hypothetical protein
MSENKMNITPTPWVAGGVFPYKGNEGYIFATSSRPEVLVCKTFGSTDENTPPLNQQLANSSAIVLAVNFTYGQQINPEAVPDILAALEGFYNDIENHPSAAAAYHYADLMNAAKAALNKAKL